MRSEKLEHEITKTIYRKRDIVISRADTHCSRLQDAKSKFARTSRQALDDGGEEPLLIHLLPLDFSLNLKWA